MKSGWQQKNLGDFCDIVGGGTPSKAIKKFWQGDIPWVSPKDMKSEVVDGSIDHISQEAIDGSATSLVPKDSILIVVRSGILARTVPIAVAGCDLTINQDLKALRPKVKLDARFLYHQLDSKMDVLLSLVSRGATVHRLMTDQIRSLNFVLPPLSEQERIASNLDEAFEGIATATAHAEKNLSNARELFDSAVNSVLENRGDGWTDRKLGDVCLIARGGSPRPIQDFITTDPTGINWIKISDATGGGKYISKTAEKIIPEGVKRSRMVKEGDFLLSNSMSFGHPYIMRTSGCIHDGWLVLSGYASNLNQDYLYHLLGSKFVYNQFDRLAAGSTVRNLNIELASRVVIPVPPLKYQQTIAETLDSLSGEIERLEAIYQQKLTALNDLKKSILHQAFTGQLH